MRVIGIDPGITGALAVHNADGLLGVYDLPVMSNGKGSAKVKNQIDAAGLAQLLREIVSQADTEFVQVVLERVSAMPGQGVSSMFSMGDSAGCIRGVVAALRLPLDYVTPQEWKKAAGVSSDKDQARTAAILLYPEAPLSRKKDHNRAEAILIARHGHRKFA